MQYGFNTVQFGDCPAAAIMSLTIERAVDLKLPAVFMQKDTDKLLRDTYVNDGTLGVSLSNVSHLMGNKHPNE